MSRTLLRMILGGALVSLAGAAFADPGRETLKGIQSVQVAVGMTEPDAARGGLIKETLQTEVELHLRQNRITVQDSVQAIPGRPMLRVDVMVFKSDSTAVDAYALSVSCELWQDILLSRNKGPATAPTWQSLRMVGLSNSGALRDQVKRIAAELVDRFINDYLAENPR